MFFSGLQLLAALVTLLEAYIKVQVCVRSVCLHRLLNHTNLTSSSGLRDGEGRKRMKWKNENIKDFFNAVLLYVVICEV